MLEKAAAGFVTGLVRFSVRLPWLVMVLALALAGASIAGAVFYVDVNTDSRGMLASDLPFQQRNEALEDAFPGIRNTTVVVVQSPTPDAAEAVVSALAQDLGSRPGIESVFAGSADPFFVSHGLLYRSVDEVRSDLAAIKESAPLIGLVARSPTLPTLLAALAGNHRLATDPEAVMRAQEQAAREAQAALAAGDLGDIGGGAGAAASDASADASAPRAVDDEAAQSPGDPDFLSFEPPSADQDAQAVPPGNGDGGGGADGGARAPDESAAADPTGAAGATSESNQDALTSAAFSNAETGANGEAGILRGADRTAGAESDGGATGNGIPDANGNVNADPGAAADPAPAAADGPGAGDASEKAQPDQDGVPDGGAGQNPADGASAPQDRGNGAGGAALPGQGQAPLQGGPGLAPPPPADLSRLDRIYTRIAEVIENASNGERDLLSWQSLTTGDGTTGSPLAIRTLEVMPRLDFTSLQPAEETRRSIEAAVDRLPTRVDPILLGDVTIGLTGDPILRFEELQSVTTGIELSMVASSITVVVLLFICYRSFQRTVVTIVAILLSLTYALGFAGVALGPLNLVSIAFAVPLVGLGLDFAIHVLTRVGELEDRGLRVQRAYEFAGRGIGLALTLAAVTTAAAFLSFVGTDFVGMGQVGVIGSVGVGIAFFVSITVVPAFSTLWNREPYQPLYLDSKKVDTLDQLPPIESKPNKLAQYARWAGAAVVTAGALAAVPLLSAVHFEADPIALRDPNSPSMVALSALLDNPSTAPYRIYHIGSREAVTAFADEAEELPEVGSVITLPRLVPDNQQAKLDLIAEEYPKIGDAVETGRQLAPSTVDAPGLLRTLLRTDPTGEGSDRLLVALARLSNQDDATFQTVEEQLLATFPVLEERLRAQYDAEPVTMDDLPTPLRRSFRSEDGVFRAEVVPQEDISESDALNAFVSAVEGVDTALAGAPIEIAEAGEVVSAAMEKATLTAGAIVLVMCLLVLRSVTGTIAVVVPLAFSGLLVVGTMAVFGIDFNYANVIVLPLIIGLGVDSAIHLATRKREDSDSSVYATSTPRAVVFSGLTTAVAFISLALSDHRGTASMGELLGLSIAVVLASTILVTPTLLELFDGLWRRTVSRKG